MPDTHFSQNGTAFRPGFRGRRSSTAGRETAGRRPWLGGPAYCFPRGFTLTELLIVIAIIAVLAALGTQAAVSALRNSKRGAISLEIKNMSAAVEDFKNKYDAYPPNVVNDGSSQLQTQAIQDMSRMFKKAFPRMDPQELVVIRALAGENQPQLGNAKVTSPRLSGGLNGEEALYFWLAGFSDDSAFPLSGNRGPSFDITTSTPEILENRTGGYGFTLQQLLPRDTNGAFDASSGRYIQYTIDLNHDGDVSDAGERRQINLWEYAPKRSKIPFVYFDTSRYKPAKYDPPAETDNGVAAQVYAVKRLREGVTSSNNLSDLAFVNFGKYQILHCGLDDAWGSFGISASSSGASMGNLQAFLYPTGPFVGDIADTLTNFTDGTLADAQENK